MKYKTQFKHKNILRGGWDLHEVEMMLPNAKIALYQSDCWSFIANDGHNCIRLTKLTADNWTRNSNQDTNLGSPHKKLSLWCYLSDISPLLRAKGCQTTNVPKDRSYYRRNYWPLTYRTLRTRRTLVQSLFFESIPRGRLDNNFPLLMYLPPDPFPLNRAELQT